MSFKKRNTKGFSLAEITISIAIIAITIGVIAVSQGNSMQSQEQTENFMIATNLAKESLEAVRNIRDKNMLKNSVWNASFNGTDDYNHTYSLNASSPVHYFITSYEQSENPLLFEWKLKHIENAPKQNFSDQELADYLYERAITKGISDFLVYQDTSSLEYVQNKEYDQNFYQKTPFIRAVEIVSGAGGAFDNSVILRSIVAWKTSKGQIRNITLSSSLYNWENQIP